MNSYFRLILPIVFAVYFVQQINSQPIMGFHAGINVAALSGHKDYEESKFRYGISGYLFMEVPINHIVSIETGISFSQQGMRHTRITNDLATRNTLNVTNQLDYVVVPIYLKENFTNFYTKIGPYGAYLVNVKSTWENTETQSFKVISEKNGTNEEFEANANPYDLGISIGFGYIHFFEPGRRRFKRRRRKRRIPVLQVDFKYNLGLRKIDITGKTPDMDFTNRTFTIGLSLTSVKG